jgi:hypothetical protein
MARTPREAGNRSTRIIFVFRNRVGDLDYILRGAFRIVPLRIALSIIASIDHPILSLRGVKVSIVAV